MTPFAVDILHRWILWPYDILVRTICLNTKSENIFKIKRYLSVKWDGGKIEFWRNGNLLLSVRFRWWRSMHFNWLIFLISGTVYCNQKSYYIIFRFFLLYFTQFSFYFMFTYNLFYFGIVSFFVTYTVFVLVDFGSFRFVFI